jgi:hypothetical protein
MALTDSHAFVVGGGLWILPLQCEALQDARVGATGESALHQAAFPNPAEGQVNLCLELPRSSRS